MEMRLYFQLDYKTQVLTDRKFIINEALFYTKYFKVNESFD